MQEIQKNEIYERIREKAFFFVTYQRRTEAQVRRNFEPLFEKNGVSKDLYEDLIEELKEKGYIDDKEYVEKRFMSYMSFKTVSIKELKHKLMQRGISKEVIQEYIDENQEKIAEYDVKAAKFVYDKKIKERTDEEVKRYLIRKGFPEDVVNKI